MAKTTIEIVVDAKDNASGVLSGIGGALGGLGKLVAGGLAVGAVAGTVAITGLTAALADAVGEAMAAQDAQAQLNSVIASTGGVAGVTNTLVNSLAQEYQNLTRFEDDAIVAGESMLLTFTNIGVDVFPEATAAMLDMSQALGLDLSQSAMLLGKTLNDPVQGIGALRRAGVQFSDAQEEMMKHLVETNQLGEAQAMILAELQREFGGSAVAAGETFAGKLDILKNKFGGVKEEIGMALLPALTDLANQLISGMNTPEFQAALQQVTDFISTEAGPKLQEFVGWLISEGGPAFMEFAAWFRDEGIPAIQEFVGFMSSAANFVGTIVEKIKEAIEVGKQLVEIVKAIGAGGALGEIGGELGRGVGGGFGGLSAIEQAALGGISSHQFGGIVPGPIGQPRLAMVHGGETVSPAGGGGPQIIQLVLDGRVLAEVVTGMQGRAARQRGQMGGMAAL